MKKIEIEDILLGEVLLDTSDIVQVYETKLEDNFNGTAVETNVFIYYTHEPMTNVLGKIEEVNRK